MPPSNDALRKTRPRVILHYGTGSMYCAKMDAQEGLAVWCWKGAEATAAEWDRHLADMKVVRGWTHLTYRPCILLHMYQDEFVPNASQRRDVAEHSRHPDYRPNLAVISGNPMIRGVMRAFTWLQPQQPYRIAPFPDIPSGVRWLEADRGRPLPRLFDLLESAHDEMRVPSILVESARRGPG